MSRPLTPFLFALLAFPVISGCTAEKKAAPSGTSGVAGTANDTAGKAGDAAGKSMSGTTSKPSAGNAGKGADPTEKGKAVKTPDAGKVPEGQAGGGAGQAGGVTKPGKAPAPGKDQSEDPDNPDFGKKVDAAKTDAADAAKAADAKAADTAAGAGAAPAVAAYEVTAKDRKNATMSWFVCATCHGQKGKGDGPAGQALNPKPRTFADAKWQKSVTDAHLFKVIKEGGASVGLSPLMAPNPHLPNGTIHALVEKVRKMGPKK